MLFRFWIHNTKQVVSTQKKRNGFSYESNCFERNLIKKTRANKRGLFLKIKSASFAYRVVPKKEVAREEKRHESKKKKQQQQKQKLTKYMWLQIIKKYDFQWQDCSIKSI